ncbi:MAG: hypothetical protein KKC20_06040 [Proteobacteria bacterium]|nr:hypothetical protein [Pseudomonadota bacterium]
MTSRTRQRLLQVGMGMGLLFLAFLVEMVAVEPPGIYSYSAYGYKGFKIGLSREKVLAQINKVTAIRRIITCAPGADLRLTSRRSFEMTEALARSSVWICQGKKKLRFVFLFRQDRLVRILRLKGSLQPGEDFFLFDRCQQEIYPDMDGFLDRQIRHRVFYEDVSLARE